MMKKTILLLLLLVLPTAKAQTTEVERILVPIYLGSSGAFGSRWVTELRVMNVGPLPAAIENFGPSSVVEFIPPELPPQAAIDGFGDIQDVLGGTGIPGALLLVKRAVASQFVFQLRARDISQDSQRLGVSIPVVPESEATTAAIDFLNIPIDPRYRQMLRVYAFDRVPGSQVSVRIYGTPPQLLGVPTAPDPLLAETTLPMQLAPTAAMPSYAELPNLALLPGVSGSSYSEIRVAVEPFGVAVWAMISVTNNTTQEVTLIAPNAH